MVQSDIEIKSKCRICGGVVRNVATIEGYPFTGGPTIEKGKIVEVGAVRVGFCTCCQLCTLMAPEPEAITYDDSYRSSNLTAAVDEKTTFFLDFLKRSGIRRGSEVLEIGCYDGSLMLMIKRALKANVQGCEPCPVAERAEASGLKVVRERYDPKFFTKKSFDYVVMRNVLEHIPYPVSFMQSVGEVLKKGGAVVLDVPDGESRLDSGILGSIVPEHTNYFGEWSLIDVLSKAGFGKVNIECYSGGLRAKAALGGNERTIFPSKLSLLRKGEQLRKNRLQSIKDLLNETDRFCLFGANTCTLELIAAGVVELGRVKLVADDDELKWGKELINSSMLVETRDKIATGENVVVCSYYSQEYLAEFFLKRGCRVLCFYPEPHWRSCD